MVYLLSAGQEGAFAEWSDTRGPIKEPKLFFFRITTRKDVRPGAISAAPRVPVSSLGAVMGLRRRTEWGG